MGLGRQGFLRFLAWVAVLLCVGGMPRVASAQPYELGIEKIVDTDTPVPGGVGTFQGFGVPTASGFVATSAGGAGVYGLSSAPLVGPGPVPVKIADTSTPIPGGTGTFTSFEARASGIFRGTGSDGQQGIYRPGSGARPLSVIADRNTAAPGGGTFTTFGTGPTGMFYAETSAGVRGIYSWGSQITTVADTSTPTQVPGRGPVAFTGFGGFLGDSTFFGTVNGKVGVYRNAPDGMRTVLDDTTWVFQSGSLDGTFDGVVNAASRDGAAFITSLSGGSSPQTVMRVPYSGAGVEAVARTGDPTPGGRDTEFYIFLAVGQDLGSPEQGPLTFFSATNLDGTSGIYFKRGFSQSVEVLIDTTMTLDGKAISSLSMGNAAVASLYGTVFRVDFEDGSSGIYAARELVPEPGSTAAVTLAFAALAGRTRRPRARLTPR